MHSHCLDNGTKQNIKTMVGSSCHIHENQNEITQIHSICLCNLGQQIIWQETGNLPCVVTTTYLLLTILQCTVLWLVTRGCSHLCFNQTLLYIYLLVTVLQISVRNNLHLVHHISTTYSYKWNPFVDRKLKWNLS